MYIVVYLIGRFGHSNPTRSLAKSSPQTKKHYILSKFWSRLFSLQAYICSTILRDEAFRNYERTITRLIATNTPSCQIFARQFYIYLFLNESSDD